MVRAMKIAATMLCGSMALALASWPALAQSYPVKPVRIVVPFAPGGPADLLARLLAQKLGDGWGQPVVVENRTGAGGNIGMEAVARATADGYTLLIAPTGNLTVNPSLFTKLGYDPIRDFAPITQLATVENVLVVNAALPVRSVQELVQLAKQKPGIYTFASPAVGSQAHLAGEFLRIATGIELIHVAYKGTGPALNDLLGGQISMMFSQTSSAIPHIRAGKLRALGVASLKRSTALPDVPTVAEQGLANFEAVSWYALMAPAGTPAEVLTKLHVDSARAIRAADARERLSALGAEAVGGTPAELAAIIRTETVRWARVIKDAGVRAE